MCVNSLTIRIGFYLFQTSILLSEVLYKGLSSTMQSKTQYLQISNIIYTSINVQL